MCPISLKRQRFPPDVIRQAVWLYFRFTLSLRDVDAALSQQLFDVAQAEREPHVEHHHEPNDLGRG